MPCGCAKTRGPTPHQCSTSPHGVLTNGSLSPLEGKQQKHMQHVFSAAAAGLISRTSTQAPCALVYLATLGPLQNTNSDATPNEAAAYKIANS